MRRPSFRRSIRLENLESRELLTAGGPSADAQLMLSMVNLARTNPSEAAQLFTTNLDPNVQATVQYYGVNLSQVASEISSSAPRPPLAWNAQIANAATGHSQDMANGGFQSHTGSNGSTTEQRLDAAGYTNRTVDGENAYAYATSVDQAMEAFLIDWGVADSGHRENILQPNSSPSQYYRDTGIGIVSSSGSSVGPYVITEDFGSQNGESAQVVGSVFNDPTHQGIYTLNNGVGNVTVQALNVNTGALTSVQTWDNGGYQIPLNPGTYKITAIDNGQVVQTQQINVSSQNVEVDFDLGNTWQGGPVPTAPTAPPVSSAPSTPAPAAPTPVQSPAKVAAASTNQTQSTVTLTWPTTAGTTSRPWYSGWSSWFGGSNN